MEFFIAFSAEEVADDDAGTNREAVEEEDEQVDDHGCGADSRKCLCADEIADNNGVNGVIQHLEYISEHKRQGEQENLFCNVAICQVTRSCFSLGHIYLRLCTVSL